jgi:hypothetical protein
MKKLIILTSMFLAASAFAVQVRTCDVSVYTTSNIVELSTIRAITLPKVVKYLKSINASENDYAAYDEDISKAITKYSEIRLSEKYNEFPKSWNAYLNRVKKTTPITAELYNKYGSTDIKKWTAEECITAYHEIINQIDRYYIKNKIKQYSERLIKIYLRSIGKTFVTDPVTKINPMQVHMDEVVAALNAPRFGNLNKWLSEKGCTAQINDSMFLSDEEINKLKMDILIGDKSFSTENVTQLQYCLGVDGYNLFVKEYNEGSVK